MSADDPKPHLLVLTSTFPRWPADHDPPFVFELARRLTSRFRVTVLAPHAPGAKSHETMDGISVQRFRYAPERFELLAYDGGIPAKLRRRPALAVLLPFFVLAELYATWRLSRRLKPAAMHAHWLLPQGLIALAARRLAAPGARLLVTAHGADVYGLRSPFARRLMRWTIEGADSVTVASRALAAEVADTLSATASVHVLPMGIDMQTQFVPGPPRARSEKLIFCGRLVRKKGVHNLIAAMPAVLHAFPGWRLMIAGDGPEQARLQALASDLGVADRVEFLGSYRNDSLPALLQSADLAVFAFEQAPGGDQEGLGLVTLEAMGCGLPVIAGDVPAVRDVIQHGRTGLLVPPQDPAALSAAIIHLISDRQLADRLVDAGRQFALTHFDWPGIAARYAERLAGPRRVQ